MEMELQGKTALVTGATAGLGRAIAIALAKEGVSLGLVGRRDALLNEVAEHAELAGSNKTHCFAVDMLQEGAPEHLVSTVRKAAMLPDILINCMGRSQKADINTPDGTWQASMTLNWERHRQLTSLIVPNMRDRRWGRVINITGKNETQGMNSAVVAKAATNAWSKGLADEVASWGITVNCIAPGRIDSEQIRLNYSPEVRRRIENEEIPVGRFGRPEELACLAVLLASPLSSYITGAVIPVDGGARRYMF
jgi:3-oxoacyl-[acyl-carrier protein] reductase